jgi:hypothetical protein
MDSRCWEGTTLVVPSKLKNMGLAAAVPTACSITLPGAKLKEPALSGAEGACPERSRRVSRHFRDVQISSKVAFSAKGVSFLALSCHPERSEGPMYFFRMDASRASMSRAFARPGKLKPETQPAALPAWAKQQLFDSVVGLRLMALVLRTTRLFTRV